ncbi:hypothetical protein Ocin01_01581 [Orchesella cincta]|uniref:Uncharacterized protein n=1 Tax=Orchesella cincta TaxID=48709 RepID=A0A1D2NIG3_ORCCI|nr:hypothetical protein Ocin01_01581 [Orchesella cincta]
MQDSFRFDQLCPDPRFGPTATRDSSHLHTPDTNINLEKGRTGNPSYSYASAMPAKEPSTTSCDFHRNGMETSAVTAVHMTENPIDFRHSNACTHFVKFSHDLYDEPGGSSTRASGGGAPRKGSKVCEKEIGIRRYINSDAVHVDSHELSQNEEVMNKMSVYFWHNFTLNSYSANYVDAITNYYLSKEDIACTKTPEYVQIAIVVSKNGGGRCEIIVQQYKIEEKRSPYGCDGTSRRIPFPIKFCGTYECSQINLVITMLKLSPRRDMNQHQNWNSYQQPTSTGKGGQKGSVGGPKPNNHQHKHRHNVENPGLDKNPIYRNQYDDDESTLVPSYDQDQNLPPCKPEAAEEQAETTILTNDDDQEKASGPIDWREPIFLIAFPLVGIVFIVLILNILRSRSARLEICRGYPRDPRHSQSMYEGSFNSIEKNSLPM